MFEGFPLRQLHLTSWQAASHFIIFFSVGLITRQAEFKECDVKTFSFSVTCPGQHNPAENQHVLYSMFGALQQEQRDSNGHGPPKESHVSGTPHEHHSVLHPGRGIWPGAHCLICFIQKT